MERLTVNEARKEKQKVEAIIKQLYEGLSTELPGQLMSKDLESSVLRMTIRYLDISRALYRYYLSVEVKHRGESKSFNNWLSSKLQPEELEVVRRKVNSMVDGKYLLEVVSTMC